MDVERSLSLALLCTSFCRQRLTTTDGVALFVKQGVIEMDLKNLVICSKYFLGLKFDNLSQYKLDMANKICENLLIINCTVIVCKVTKSYQAYTSITNGMIHLTTNESLAQIVVNDPVFVSSTLHFNFNNLFIYYFCLSILQW